MRPDLIVERLASYYILLGITNGVVGPEIDLLIFETPPQSFDKDVVAPTTGPY